MIKNNYHTHTARCGHAVGTDEEYVLESIKAGLETLGFSDHEEFNDPHFDRPEETNAKIEDYISSVKSLKQKYKGKINVKLGLEFGYYPEKEELLKKWKERGIEYFVLGQHTLKDEKGDAHYFQGFHITNELVTQYYDSLITAVKTGHFIYVAHPDLIFANQYNEEITDWYFHEARRFIEVAKEYDIPLELNNNGLTWGTKFKYPYDPFWKIVGEVGNRVIIGLDIHNPKTFENLDLSFIYNLVKKYNLKLIDKVDI